jgi:hypothetical protein
MNKFPFYLLFLSNLLLFSQPNTEVFLFNLNTNSGGFELSNFKNISQNEGYDNQPSFLDDNTILYAGTRNGQTDIVKYYVNYDSKIFINHTDGSEYSPLKIPNKNAVSSIRLEKDGAQKLYKYSLKNGESEVLIDDIIIGYHVWFDDKTLVSSVLEDNGLSLFATHFDENKNYRLQKKIGRSLHKIPNTDLVSFISKENDSLWEIKSLNPFSGVTKSIVMTLPQAEDMCWLPNGTILMGKDDRLYTFRPNYDVDWNEVTTLEEFKISNISRVIVSPDGSKLALVGEGGLAPEENTESGTTKTETSKENPTETEAIVQKQLEAYNNRDIDAFMATYSQDIKLYNYPNELTTEGQEQMRKSYKEWFDKTPDLNAHIKKRMVIGNKVIDEEQVTANGQIFHAIAIYEIENGLIKKVTFIQ